MDHKKILQELSKRDDLKNKVCNDCSNPNPQWASLSFAIFICLQCAGTHRGFGVHVSFVRSISMDTWQDDQVKRMQLGGNAPFREFMRSYAPAEQGGYSDNLSSYDTYHCWAATQYREKLDALVAGRDWTPSLPSESVAPARPSSAQGLRKSRTSNRANVGSSLRSESGSPASFGNNSPRGTPDLTSVDQKTANENYFASLGATNANRPADLPPSQGGRYQGFGSTPSPSEHPSYGLSSRAAPSLGELQENPMAALSKGWSLFSSAVAGASRAVNENIIQPGMEKVNDPNLQASMKGYWSEAQKRATEAGSTANQWSKNQLGVDVADRLGGAVGSVRDRISGGPTRAGYDSLATEHEAETSALYHDGDDFFNQWDQPQQQSSSQTQPSSVSASKPAAASKKTASDWDEEWKDF
ncbi:ArfGap-domain-containing protein [Dendrothele bispora CBS 962.96]|uniref:ArfGap-domain-containing protein n=1 Tax=Dendrothele bispora (strain CBS 962.96) TaxID=1314807 RepID=A0A4S8MY07_DENBC|nr:ArfGap-domain-containing protein [Dendrothele bispora CBS 962.96]